MPLASMDSDGDELAAEAFFQRLMDGPLVSAGAETERVPEAVGPWRVRDPMGQGGTSRVYHVVRATDGAPQWAALKLARRPGAAAQARMQREAERLRRFCGQHVPRLLDAGTHADGRPYLVLERIEGHAITHVARSRTARGRVQLLSRACRAVDCFHTEGLIHGDLKPEHLLVRTDGTVAVLDLGLATDLRDANEATHARTSLTPEFAAPEQVLGERVGLATDVYTLGLVLHEMLHGRSRRLPWSLGGDPEAPGSSAVRHRGLRPEGAVSDLEEAIDCTVAPVLRMALQPRSQKRYASAGALARALDAVVRETTHARGPEPSPPLPSS